MNIGGMLGVKKALVVTTVASTLDQFCMNEISILKQTYEVHVAANFTIGNNTSKERVTEFRLELENEGIVVNEMNFNRNPLNINNFSAYLKLKKLLEVNSFDIIHCHTPVAAMLVRIAAKAIKRKSTNVFYTAHGFHFYRGAPLINWLLYYPVEWWLAKYTDVLITINKEDNERANKAFKAKQIQYIPGVGIDIRNFDQIKINKLAKRQEIGVPMESFVVLSVGELNKNKNHEVVIRALSKVENNQNIYYVICGQGILNDNLKKLINDLGLEKQIKLLGYREDIPEICKVSDVFAFPSFREGLSVALMEAMAAGLPVVCSAIRGNLDLIEEGKGGYLVEPWDEDGFADAIQTLADDEHIRKIFQKYNKERIKSFSLKNVKEKMECIYKMDF